MSATALVSEIPHSEDTVQVSIIDTTLALYGVPHKLLLSPEIPGWAPPPMVAYSLLIEHSSGRSVLYDLGLRKDWENLSPMIVEMIKILDIEVKKDIPEILAARGISVDDIEAIIPR